MSLIGNTRDVRAIKLLDILIKINSSDHILCNTDLFVEIITNKILNEQISHDIVREVVQQLYDEVKYGNWEIINLVIDALPELLNVMVGKHTLMTYTAYTAARYAKLCSIRHGCDSPCNECSPIINVILCKIINLITLGGSIGICPIDKSGTKYPSASRYLGLINTMFAIMRPANS